VGPAFFERWLVIHYKKSVLANEVGDLLELLARVFALDEARFERGFGLVGNDVGGQIADIAAANAADVQRGLLQKFD